MRILILMPARRRMPPVHWLHWFPGHTRGIPPRHTTLGSRQHLRPGGIGELPGLDLTGKQGQESAETHQPQQVPFWQDKYDNEIAASYSIQSNKIHVLTTLDTINDLLVQRS